MEEDISLVSLHQSLGTRKAIHLIVFTAMSYTHMASPMPIDFRKRKPPPRGVSNRRAAIQWIRNNVQSGVLYFGDDDNTYDLRLFEEIRFTRYLSVFPVGLVGEYAVSAPVVQNVSCFYSKIIMFFKLLSPSPIFEQGKLVGFYDSWPAGRHYPIDMGGFAVSVDLLLRRPNANMIYKAGYEEDYFLRDLHLDFNNIEVKADNCTEVGLI